MPALTLRPAGVDDIDAVLSFWLAAAEGTDRSDTRDGVAALLARDPEALILATDDAEIVGSLIAGWDGWRCHLYRLAVRPDRRRQRIARALLDEAERRCAAAGARRVNAMVLDGNELGQRTWTALGYHPQEEWTRWVRFRDEPARGHGRADPGRARR
jgi:ribosomal protein S18 acetylase RimI-like enzyme